MGSRKFVKPEVKAAILKQFMQKKVPISELAEKHGVQPSNIYQWQNQLFSDAPEIFERRNDRRTGKKAADRNEKRIIELEEKLAAKDAVLGEVMEEFVRLKKQHGAT